MNAIRMRTHQWVPVALAFATAGIGGAQQAQISMSGGSATDVLGNTSNAVTVAPSLFLSSDPRFVLTLGGSGTRFQNDAWSLAGRGGVAVREPMGPLALTLNGSYGATFTSYNNSYGLGEAIPAVELSLGPATVYGGARALIGSASIAQQSAVPGTLPGAPSRLSSNTTQASNQALGPLGGARLRVSAPTGETFELGIRADRMAMNASTFTEQQASASFSQGATTLSGVVGMLTQPSSTETFGSAALSFALNGSLSLDVGAGSYASNPVLEMPGGRFASVGLSMRFGAPSAPRLPYSTHDGVTRLSIRADQATSVEVAGDFSNWNPVTARRCEDGTWCAKIRIPPGHYRYAFRVDGREWTVPEGSSAMDSDFGGKVAWLDVPSSPSSGGSR